MYRVAILDSDQASLEAVSSMVRSFGWSCDMALSCYESTEMCKMGFAVPTSKNTASGSLASASLCDVLFVSTDLDGVAGRGIDFVKGMQAASHLCPQVVFWFLTSIRFRVCMK